MDNKQIVAKGLEMKALYDQIVKDVEQLQDFEQQQPQRMERLLSLMKYYYSPEFESHGDIIHSETGQFLEIYSQDQVYDAIQEAYFSMERISKQLRADMTRVKKS